MAESTASRAAVPWYQRFTTSNGVTGSITGERENDRVLPPAWSLSQRWGSRSTCAKPSGSSARRKAAAATGSVGAYYQFTPNMRLGGESQRRVRRTAADPDPAERRDEPRADVRIRSAFRF